MGIIVRATKSVLYFYSFIVGLITHPCGHREAFTALFLFLFPCFCQVNPLISSTFIVSPLIQFSFSRKRLFSLLVPFLQEQASGLSGMLVVSVEAFLERSK